MLEEFAAGRRKPALSIARPVDSEREDSTQRQPRSCWEYLSGHASDTGGTANSKGHSREASERGTHHREEKPSSLKLTLGDLSFGSRALWNTELCDL